MKYNYNSLFISASNLLKCLHVVLGPQKKQLITPLHVCLQNLLHRCNFMATK